MAARFVTPLLVTERAVVTKRCCGTFCYPGTFCQRNDKRLSSAYTFCHPGEGDKSCIYCTVLTWILEHVILCVCGVGGGGGGGGGGG